MSTPQHILLSRTDSIGDVVLALPMAQYLQQAFPGVRISFLGRPYTRAVIEACPAVDGFISREDFLSKPLQEMPDAIVHVFPDSQIAFQALRLGIKNRIGTTNRVFHWWTCNRLVRLSRKNADLHESQLNMRLLRPFNIPTAISLDEMASLMLLEPQVTLPPRLAALLDPAKPKIILHPKSQGSAREWGLENFEVLARMLIQVGYQVFVSGTEAERQAMQPLLQKLEGMVTPVAGLMDLETFIAFIAACDGLVAASTGPLHLAAALGKRAMGIYPSIRPMHPGRWAPVGAHAIALTARKHCEACRKTPADCSCMLAVAPGMVLEELNALFQD